jgi:monoamine oxidase
MPVDTGQFGITLGEGPTHRGMASVVWNFKPFTRAPILCSLLTGSAAVKMESLSDSEVVSRALDALEAVFGHGQVPPVQKSCCARWGEDEYSRGSYSYVAIGGSGDSYDLLARPLGRSVLFCGEHTSKEHLDTVGGAIRSGIREVCVFVS